MVVLNKLFMCIYILFISIFNFAKFLFSCDPISSPCRLQSQFGTLRYEQSARARVVSIHYYVIMRRVSVDRHMFHARFHRNTMTTTTTSMMAMGMRAIVHLLAFSFRLHFLSVTFKNVNFLVSIFVVKWKQYALDNEVSVSFVTLSLFEKWPLPDFPGRLPVTNRQQQQERRDARPLSLSSWLMDRTRQGVTNAPNSILHH